MPKGKIFSVSLLWLSLTICLFLELSAYAGDSCPINIPTEPGNVDHTVCESSTIAWNDPASADTIARNSSCIIAITDTGNGGPYTWTVSGKGFSLNNPLTKGLSNTLYANGTACGTATVTVTGCNGQQVTGYVRCTAGKWVLIYSCGNGVSNCSWYGSIRGKYKYDASWCFRGYPWSTCATSCTSEPGCSTPLWRDCYYGTCYCNWARTWEWGCP